MSRTQVNFRLDNDLLAAIKAKCEVDNINLTEFLTDAARTALGIERMVRTTYPSSDALESLRERLSFVESRLEDCLASKEKVERIEKQMGAVLGECSA